MASRGDPISRRALGRALLARQSLLEREATPALEMVERLVALQAQVPGDPYVGLWSRLAAFDPLELSALMESRAVARATLLRTTIHLASARDLLAIRPLVAPVLERNFRSGSPFGRRLPGVDMAPVRAAAREAMDAAPRTRTELRTMLGERWPDRDADAMAVGVCILEPLVQATPRGLWQRSGQPAWSTMRSWFGAPLDESTTLDDLVSRYLAAFGPASAADATAWSGITRLGEVFERLRPRLRAFRTDAGRELLDLPTRPGRTPTRRRRSGSCPSTTTWCWATRTGVGSSRTGSPRCSGRTSGWGPSWWMGCSLGPGASRRRRRRTRSSCGRSLRRTRGRLAELEAEGMALATFLRPGAATIGLRWLPA